MPRKFVVLYTLIFFLVGMTASVLIYGRVPIQRAVILSGIISAAVFAVLLVEGRSLGRALRSVIDAMRRIDAGQYGQEVPANVEGDAGRLVRTFNEMSAGLAEKFAMVEQDRQQLRAVLDGMIEGVVAIDAQQRLLFANERGAKLLEFNPRTAIGLRFWEIVRQRQIVALVEGALEKSEPQRQEFDWKGQSGKSLAVQVQPLLEPLGGAIVVVHDTSDLRRLERLRHEFVANVSHELKTPLAVIRASVETLQDGAVDDVAHRGIFLEQIHDQGDRLNNLILDLLSLARIEAGDEAMEYSLVHIADVVEDCFERHRPRAAVKRQTLEAVPAAEASSNELRTDEEALAQILDNLVDNAIKYTPEEGRIEVRWYGLGDQICFEVRDNGPGIPEEDLPRIFERFYRVDKARSRELGGTGLGLAIVKNLVQILRGNVSVQSKQGVGTTFLVSLPRAPR